MLAEATLSSRIVGISDQRSQNLRIPGDKECALTYRTRPVADQLGYGLGVNLDDSTISVPGSGWSLSTYWNRLWRRRRSIEVG